MPQRLLKLPDVMQITTLGKSTIYRLMSEEKFPRPINLTEKAVAWKLSDIEQWLQSKQAT